jgi:hypothetical protein
VGFRRQTATKLHLILEHILQEATEETERQGRFDTNLAKGILELGKADKTEDGAVTRIVRKYGLIPADGLTPATAIIWAAVTVVP